MADIEMEMTMLGLEPYILLRITDMDEDDVPTVTITAGGGIGEADIPIVMGAALDAMGHKVVIEGLELDE